MVENWGHSCTSPPQMEHALKEPPEEFSHYLLKCRKFKAGTWLIDEKNKIRAKERGRAMTPEGESYTILFVVTSSHVFCGIYVNPSELYGKVSFRLVSYGVDCTKTRAEGKI